MLVARGFQAPDRVTPDATRRGATSDRSRIAPRRQAFLHHKVRGMNPTATITASRRDAIGAVSPQRMEDPGRGNQAQPWKMLNYALGSHHGPSGLASRLRRVFSGRRDTLQVNESL